jgi:integrase
LEQLGHAFTGKRLSNITPWALEAYKKARTEAGAPVRVNRELAILKTLFNKMTRLRLYEGDNPVVSVKFRKEEKTRLRFLEREEERQLLEHASEPLRTLILVGIYTGLRIQAEALALRWEDVDLRRKLLRARIRP